MIGTIIGDLVGSRYEFFNKPNTKDFIIKDKCTFTDDTVLTMATINALENNQNFLKYYKKHFLKHPFRLYGPRFVIWALFKRKPNYSFGNGCAMRISPIAYVSDDLNEILDIAEKSIITTHNHPEAIKGGKALITAIYLARNSVNKDIIKETIEKKYNYDLSLSVEELRKNNGSNATCQGSIPHAIISFLESNDFESCLRNAIYIGGDTDTVAAMACSIAESYYKEIPNNLYNLIYRNVPLEYTILLKYFYDKYDIKYKIIS